MNKQSNVINILEPWVELKSFYRKAQWIVYPVIVILATFLWVLIMRLWEIRQSLIVIWGVIYKESGILGLFVSSAALIITLHISREQDKQIKKIESLSKGIDSHVLGTLRGFDRVMESLTNLLVEANNQQGSTVYFMAYWLWFGADTDFLKGSDQLTNTSSRVWQSLRGRIAEGQKRTTVVIFEDKQRIHSFVQKLIQYRVSANTLHIADQAALASQIVDDYMLDIEWIKEESRRSNNLKLKFSSEIPALIFAVEGIRNTGLWYIGETEMLVQGSQLGGFISSNPAMVGMLADQVKHLSR
jgi:hypothetical protein